ncbi:peroxisomal carnitine O-octanoyltransferase-like [Crocuta crocuta]
MVMVNISHYVDEKILENEGRWKGSEKVRNISLPEELVFTVDDKILNNINQAEAQYLKQASDLQIVAYAFTSFGKKLTKKKRLHPDTFVQLALQLAYYRLHGRMLHAIMGKGRGRDTENLKETPHPAQSPMWMELHLMSRRS